MDDTKRQLVEKLHGATNILVTVSANPSVDQLTACLGLTLWLNKADKRAVAIFSGDIPNALEFLQPEATIEKTTDSLRDFIIALDKSKADKLRYKVEDRVVKIFITPYRTSLSANDLEFSQGDFNVDAVIAIGVGSQTDLDNAITAHGRILHDAVVITINNSTSSNLGSINWLDSTASCLSELVYDLGRTIAADKADPQIATALLTGIVAATERFSNGLTTPHTMTIAAELMSAGANQQLVVNKLEAPQSNAGKHKKTVSADRAKDDSSVLPPEPDNGTLEIKRDIPEPDASQPAQNDAVQSDDPAQPTRLVIKPPTMGSALNANDHPENLPEPSTDPLSLPPVEPDQNRPPLPVPDDRQTLSQIEQSVASPHLSEQHIDDLRNQVENAIKTGPEPLPKPVEALNAVNVDLQTPAAETANTDPLAFNPNQFEASDAGDATDSSDLPPQVPPPILPPDFLPPAPPA